jgi:hypothetical protein
MSPPNDVAPMTARNPLFLLAFFESANSDAKRNFKPVAV